MINSGKESENIWLFLGRSKARGRTMKIFAWGRQMFDEKTILRVHKLLSECHEFEGLTQFEAFIRTRIREVLPHRIAVCGFGEIRSKQLLRSINIGFPGAYLRQISGPQGVLAGAPLDAWVRERSPLVLHVDQVTDPQAASWCDAAKAHDITTTACHGVCDMTSTLFSYFEFGRLDEDKLSSYPPLLNLIVPHLHAALARLLAMEAAASPASARFECHGAAAGLIAAPLLQAQASLQMQEPGVFAITARERQVLQWIAAGKSNWEIGKILRISEFTVKNHVQNVLRKLSVTSRAQAVTKGIFCGLIGHA